MKIFIAQQNYHIGNFEENTARIRAAIRKAKAAGGELIVFSELAVCGYPPRDFLEFDDFIEQCLDSIDAIAAEADTIGVLVGAPARNPEPEGKDLFNAAYFLYEGKIQQVVHKTLLPNYDIFDEYRYFEPANAWQVVNFKDARIAVTICEDIWNLGRNPMYRTSPMEELIGQSPNLMINLSASPFDYVHADGRKNIIRQNVSLYKLPIIYCNTVGAQTEVLFDGGSIVMSKYGELVLEMPYFEEDMKCVQFRADGSFEESVQKPAHEVPIAQLMPDQFDAEMSTPRIYQALLTGIRDYFSKMGIDKAIVASSGGIDSALVLTLACEALGPDRVRSLLMPSEFSSGHSVTDAEKLSQNLGSKYDIIPIKSLFTHYLENLAPVFEDIPFGIAEENLQSRIRGSLVMAVSNKLGGILLNTSNKSELATGYGTLYGDMAGGLSVIGDLYKTQVYALAKYINRKKEIIPVHILQKAPSAELRPNQKDSDSLPDYSVMDPILYQYIERRLGPDEIIASGAPEALVHRILRLVNLSEYKRNQFCPILRVSPKSFGLGRRMPIVGKYLS